MTTNHLLTEVALILRGDHPRWEGDRIWNAESYLSRFAKDMPEEAKKVLADIERNRAAASEVSELHPNRVQWIVNRLRESNPLLNMWADKT